MKTDFIEIFQTIRAVMQPYAVEGFKAKVNSDFAYHLTTDQENKNEVVKNKEIYFFGIEVRDEYVGFYYNPIYTDTEINLLFTEDFKSILIEKDCFHITQLSDLLLHQITNTLKLGSKFYKQKGWG